MRTTIEIAAANRDPVLIIGETWVLRVETAWHVHDDSTQRPFKWCQAPHHGLAMK